MKTDIRQFLVAVSTLGLLASCAQTGSLEIPSENAGGGEQNSAVFADHEGIARQYENTAKTLLLKAAEHKKLLQHYDDKSYLYGRRGQDFQSRAVALERKYKREAEKAASYAAFHRKIASENPKRYYASGRNPAGQLGGR
jgi:hypothetical protein